MKGAYNTPCRPVGLRRGREIPEVPGSQRRWDEDANSPPSKKVLSRCLCLTTATFYE